jgi:N6-L-threonylcarbamoyladenine synthase
VLCLGIESSCDETGLALVEDGKLLAAVLATQADVHALFGGVVPELASREHYRFIGPLFDDLMERAGKKACDIEAIAVSRGPGLLGALLVGVAFAKGLAVATGARLVGINHLHAHLLAAGLEQPLHFPALGMLVSGGHTHIYRVEGAAALTTLGKTLDDAAGEAFDKVAKVLGLPYPGGKLLDELAMRGKAEPLLFPRPYMDNDNLDFSFSGLKTAVAQYVAAHPELLDFPHPLRDAALAPHALCDLCASFNLAVAETLCMKLERALHRNKDVHHILLAGGVAANSLLRQHMAALAQRHACTLVMPSLALCTDNAAMVAYAGWCLASQGFEHSLDFETIPRGKSIPHDMQRRAIA